MKKYIPKHYYKSIFTINYEKLLKENIKCLVFDLDNTIACTNQKIPDEKIINHSEYLKKLGFKIIILSNALKSRVKPYKDMLNIESCHFACKPLKFKYKYILKKFNFHPNEIVAIGDQLFTDIKGANKMGIQSILITPISAKENIITRINRIRENHIYKKLEKAEILKRGIYDK